MKVPRDRAGKRNYAVGATDSDNWADFETALATTTKNGWGIGLVFDASNDLVGIDIDDGRNHANGRPSDLSKCTII